MSSSPPSLKLFKKPKTGEVREEEPKSFLRNVVEWMIVFVVLFGLVLLIRTLFLQPFYITSKSMEPTLEANDRVLVNKLSYKVHDINRGDLIVFHRPENVQGEIDDLIKRVVGLPGEEVKVENCRVYINGQFLEEPYLEEMDIASLQYRRACLNRPMANNICLDSPNPSLNTVVVPEGHIFVMGDNRTNSTDSRSFGCVSDSSVVGRAFVRIWPLGDVNVL